MRKLFFLALALASVASLAAERAPFASFDEDRFLALDDLFEGRTGTPSEPTADRVMGWWTGRCFYHSDHNKAVASVMATQSVDPSGSAGPLFPAGGAAAKMALGVRFDRAANWFDEVGPKGEKLVKDFIAEYFPLVTTLSSRDKSLAFEFIANNGMAVLYRTREVRAQTGSYFVAKGTMLKAWKDLREGDTQSICYYFDKVKVNPSFVEPSEPAPQPGVPFPGGTTDCTCSSAGVWVATCPQAIGVWPGGRREPGINVRRCGALNGGATSGVCTPGSTKNIYENPAPAITNLCGGSGVWSGFTRPGHP